MDKQVLMLGLDALVPNILEKFVDEGIIPNFKHLFEEGCFTRLLSSIPAQTPANWHTVATGAKPGTHTVTVWGAHRPDDSINEIHRAEAFNSGLCLAEYVWETAARCGKRSVVMNYAGYPPTTGSAVHIDRLYQPARSYYDIAPPTVYHTLDTVADSKIQFEKADGWKNLSESTLPPLSAEIHVSPASEGDGPAYFALLIAQGDGYDTLALCKKRDAKSAIFDLRLGEWNEWITAEFNTEEMGEVEGAFRFKLVECSPDAEKFRLFRSGVFPTDGRFISDPELGEKLIETLGPYIHGVMTAQLHVGRGILDWETVDEELIDEAKWWSSAAKLAMEETNAELLYLHWHLPDLIGHKFIPWIDPTGTAYTPERAEEGWKQIRNYYRAIDRFVGEFLTRFSLDETVIAIVAEHGMPANKKAVALVNAFKDKGWLKLTDDGKGVIWQESKLFFEQNHLWINLQGRETTGVVSSEEYKELRAEIQKVMRNIKDPETGEHAF